MKILTVNLPLQTPHLGEHPKQYVTHFKSVKDGSLVEYIPTWCVKTERPRLDEPISKWFQRKEEEIGIFNKKHKHYGVDVIEGIYLYDINALYQGVGDGADENGDIKFTDKICYYIRYDYVYDRHYDMTRTIKSSCGTCNKMTEWVRGVCQECKGIDRGFKHTVTTYKDCGHIAYPDKHDECQICKNRKDEKNA